MGIKQVDVRKVWNDKELVNKLNGLHASVTKDKMYIGKILEIKESLEHGKFIEWIENSGLNFGIRQAQRYIKFVNEPELESRKEAKKEEFKVGKVLLKRVLTGEKLNKAEKTQLIKFIKIERERITESQAKMSAKLLDLSLAEDKL